MTQYLKHNKTVNDNHNRGRHSSAPERYSNRSNKSCKNLKKENTYKS